MRRRMVEHFRIYLGIALMVTPLTGCALSWDDADGKRHLLGLGYMAVPQPRPNSNVTVHGLDMAGIGLSATRERTGLTLGYLSERFLTLGEEAAVEMPCLTCAPQDLMLRPVQLPYQ
ncbi:MAG: hypothetical protein ACKPAC_09290 [Alphaproteobacteria bacterium]